MKNYFQKGKLNGLLKKKKNQLTGTQSTETEVIRAFL